MPMASRLQVVPMTTNKEGEYSMLIDPIIGWAETDPVVGVEDTNVNVTRILGRGWIALITDNTLPNGRIVGNAEISKKGWVFLGGRILESDKQEASSHFGIVPVKETIYTSKRYAGLGITALSLFLVVSRNSPKD